jgi:hypothetical protein
VNAGEPCPGGEPAGHAEHSSFEKWSHNLHIVGLTIISFFLLELTLQLIAYGRRNIYVHVLKNDDNADPDDDDFDVLPRRVGNSRGRTNSGGVGGDSVENGLESAIAEIERLTEEQEREENQ